MGNMVKKPWEICQKEVDQRLDFWKIYLQPRFDGVMNQLKEGVSPQVRQGTVQHTPQNNTGIPKEHAPNHQLIIASQSYPDNKTRKPG